MPTYAVLNVLISIIDRLKERGWEEELDKLSPGSGPTDQVVEVVKACQSELTEPSA